MGPEDTTLSRTPKFVAPRMRGWAREFGWPEKRTRPTLWVDLGGWNYFDA